MNDCAQRLARHANCPPWRSPFSTGELIGWFGKGLQIPAGGWNRHNFAKDGQRLIVLIHRMAMLAQRKAVPHVAKLAAEVLNNQVESVISHVLGRRKMPLALDEGLWLQALEEVMREQGMAIVMKVAPPVQSVMSQGYSKIATVLGNTQRTETNVRIVHESQEIAAKITRINDTTRSQIESRIKASLEAGQTVQETAKVLRDEFPTINHNRSLTIARTELNNAVTRGSAFAFLECNNLTHVSIIGCDSREENSPQYDGESTCNYENLPKEEIEAFLEVGFHPNHQGTMVVASFA